MTWISPDCRDGNHRKCNGEAWDEDADDLTDCQCPECLCQVSPAIKTVDDTYDCHACGAEVIENCYCPD